MLVDNAQLLRPGSERTGGPIEQHPPGGASSAPSSLKLTPAQRRVFADLFAIGAPRPVAQASLADDLRALLKDRLTPVLAGWTENSLWVGKSQLATVMRCEGQLAADASQPRSKSLPLPTAIGIVVHRAIQLTHTHPGRSCDEYVKAAIQGSRSEQAFEAFWSEAPDHIQSDVIVAAASRLISYLDSIPPLQSSWSPRFEEPISARIGSLVLAAKPDLVLGRPRPDGRQTMLLCDMKSTDLRDYHLEEAHFYALIGTLRYGCPPFRSCVLSLTTMEWTAPDIDASMLYAAAERVIEGTTRIVEVLTESRGASLVPGRHCTWCPSKSTCPSHEAWDQAGSPSDPTMYAIGAAPVTVTAEAPRQMVSAPSSRTEENPYSF